MLVVYTCNGLGVALAKQNLLPAWGRHAAVVHSNKHKISQYYRHSSWL